MTYILDGFSISLVVFYLQRGQICHITHMHGSALRCVRSHSRSIWNMANLKIQIWTTVDCNGAMVHGGNVILPEAKITPENLIFPESWGLKE